MKDCLAGILGGKTQMSLDCILGYTMRKCKNIFLYYDVSVMLIHHGSPIERRPCCPSTIDHRQNMTYLLDVLALAAIAGAVVHNSARRNKKNVPPTRKWAKKCKAGCVFFPLCQHY